MNERAETQHIASTRGVTLALHHLGGDGPPLLINHATGFHARCYLPMAEHLVDRFAVWGADFAGHGASTSPDDGDFAWKGFAEDVLAVVDHLGIDRVNAFGHSMGGAAILLAERMRPGLFDAAFLYEPIVFPPEVLSERPRNTMMAEAAANRRNEFPAKADALARYASRPPLGLMRADVLWNYVEHGFVETEHGTVELACAPSAEAATFANAGPRIPDVAGAAARTVVGYGMGEVHNPGPAAFASPLAAALPNAEARGYEGLDHFGPLQDPNRIAADLLAFFA